MCVPACEPKKRNNSVCITQAGNYFAEFPREGRLAALPAILASSIPHQVATFYAKRKAPLWGLYNKVNQVVDVRSLCRMSNQFIVLSLLKQEILGSAQTTFTHSKGTRIQACEHVFRPKLKNKLSHLGQIVTMQSDISLWTAAHLSAE